MIVFGGWNGNEFFNDVYVLDLEIMAWSKPSTTGPAPSPRKVMHTLSVPLYNSANPMPLVISFHGYGSNATNNFNASDFNGIADTAGFIVVYPQGALRQGSTHWNVGGWVFGSTVDDLGFTNALIENM